MYDKAWETIDTDELLKPNPELAKLFQDCPYRKICFTNTSVIAATKILKSLGVLHCFESVFCVNFDDFILTHRKPNLSAYEFIENCYGVKVDENGLKNVIFFDDTDENVKIALEIGWYAHLVDDCGLSVAKIKSIIERYEAMIFDEKE